MAGIPGINLSLGGIFDGVFGNKSKAEASEAQTQADITIAQIQAQAQANTAKTIEYIGFGVLTLVAIFFLFKFIKSIW